MDNQQLLLEPLTQVKNLGECHDVCKNEEGIVVEIKLGRFNCYNSTVDTSIRVMTVYCIILN